MASPKTDERIPAALVNNALLVDLVGQYLSTLDKVSTYNETYRQVERDPDAPTPNKLLTEAKGIRQAESEAVEKGEEFDNGLSAEIIAGLDAWDEAWEAVAAARKVVADHMAIRKGIDVAPEAPKPDESETKILRDRRKEAVELGKAMKSLAKLTGRKAEAEALETFLGDNELPEVGREGSANFNEPSQTAPKYRVDVSAVYNGSVIVTKENGRGFTKAAHSARAAHKAAGLSQDTAPTREQFQKVWESAGNVVGKTVLETVPFTTSDGVIYTLSLRK